MKNLAALRVLAASVFVANPSFESVVAFADGNVFNAEKKNAIDFHKKGNKGMKTFTIERDEVEDLIEEKEAEIAERKAKAKGGDAPATEEATTASTTSTDKKDEWKGTTIPEIESVLKSKEIDFSSAKNKGDLVAICNANKLTKEDVEALAAELKAAEEGDNK